MFHQIVEDVLARHLVERNSPDVLEQLLPAFQVTVSVYFLIVSSSGMSSSSVSGSDSS